LPGSWRDWRGLKAYQRVHLAVQVRGIEVRVALGHPRVAVPHDPLHEGRVRAAHREQAAGRVAEIVELDRAITTDVTQSRRSFCGGGKGSLNGRPDPSRSDSRA
jgi:hypothetical protein